MGNELVKRDVAALAEFGPLTLVADELVRGALKCVVFNAALNPSVDLTEVGGKKAYTDNNGVRHEATLGKALLSPAGADRLNRAAGIQVIEMKGEGWRRDIENARGGLDLCVRSAVAIGRDALGNRVMAGPMTVSFSPRAYLMHALTKLCKPGYAKAGKDPAPQACYWDLDGTPPPLDGAWKRFDLDGEIGLWANMDDKAVGTALDTYAQDRKFADRRCRGMLSRNLLCAHPGGFPKHPVPDASGVYRAPVRAWQPVSGDTEQEIRELAEKIAMSDDPTKALPAGTRIVNVTVEDNEMDEARALEDTTDASDAETDNPGGF